MQRLRIFIIAAMVFELAALAHGQQLNIVDNLAGSFEDISASTPLSAFQRSMYLTIPSLSFSRWLW